MGTNFLADRQAVLARKHQIQDDQVRIFVQDAPAGQVAPVFGQNPESLRRQIFLNQSRESCVVFHQEDGCLVHGQVSALRCEPLPPVVLFGRLLPIWPEMGTRVLYCRVGEKSVCAGWSAKNLFRASQAAR